MGDRDFYDALRIKAHSLALKAARQLDADGTSDGKMAPHVARDEIMKLRRLAKQMNAMADLVEALSHA